MPDRPFDFNRISPRIAVANWRHRLVLDPEQRDEDNVPVNCPIEPDAMESYIDFVKAQGVVEDGFDPCNDCEFFKTVRLDGQARIPTREAGRWYDYGLCMAPGRPEPTVVNVHAIESRARKVTDDDAENTNEMVLDCIDDGCKTVRQIVEATGLAERSVFKVLARLRAVGIVAPGTPLRRFSSLRATVRPEKKVVTRV